MVYGRACSSPLEVEDESVEAEEDEEVVSSSLESDAMLLAFFCESIAPIFGTKSPVRLSFKSGGFCGDFPLILRTQNL